MSLSSILTMASAGLTNNTYQIALSNANIANASDTSYSRKTASFSTIDQTLALSSATTTRVADTYLTRATAQASAASSRDAAISSALETYDGALGSVASGDDISSRLSTLESSLTSLKTAGATAAAKSDVVYSATQLATTIKSLSSTIQSLRTQANSDIASTVATVNTAADKIATLNAQIVSTAASGGDTTNLEDQRDAALQTLSGAMGVSYFKTSDNRIQVFTSGGDLLVGTTASHLTYSASTTLGAAATYPGQIDGIRLEGKDITSTISSGTLGGLVQLRDTTLVSEQSKLDQLAGALISTANEATNAGSAYPAPSTLTGSATVASGDTLSATGTLRVAVTSSSGTVTATQDLDLSSMSTVSDLVTALNAVPGLSASISSAGKLMISTTDASQGVALADMGASVGASGSGVSNYFGLNNLFSGTDASTIGVSAALQTNPSALPTAALTTASGLAVGATALTSADSTVADALTTALAKPTSFSAAGDFPAQSVSLEKYASNFVSGAATLVSNATATSETSKATYIAAKSRLENLTSVNTDQELAMLTTYQQQYQANAQMITVVRALFDSLINMMS